MTNKFGKTHYLLLCAIGLAAAGCVISVATRNLPRLDAATVEQIQYGMSEDQVVDILGVRAGDYSTFPEEYHLAFNPFCYAKKWGDRPLAARKDWITDEAQLILGFNDRREVIHILRYPLGPAPSRPLTALLLPFHKFWAWLWSLL